ncbi:helix-turn-helix domain-containing protein [Nocardia sp. NPDC004750]
MTTRDLSQELGIPEGTLRFWRHSGVGPASFSIRKRVVYRRTEVDRWIKEQETATKRGGCDVA